MITVAAADLPGAIDSKERLAGRAEALVRRASRAGARLIVLPELCLSGYALGREMAERAEPVAGPSSDRIVALAGELDVVIVAGLAERAGRDVYDTVIVASGAGVIGRYRKEFVSSAETACFRSGEGPSIIETPVGRLGLGICADMQYESHWASMRGRVDLVVISAGWPDFRRATGLPLGRAFRVLHTRCMSALPRRIGRYVGAPVVFANLTGAIELAPAMGPVIHASGGGRSLVIDHQGAGFLAQDGLAVAPVHLAPLAVHERGAHWTPVGGALFRAGLPALDRLSAWLHRPVYAWRRMRMARAGMK